MKLENIEPGDVLVSVDRRGAGYYKVLKMHRVMITVRSENGNEFKAFPSTFDRRVTYAVKAFEREPSK